MCNFIVAFSAACDPRPDKEPREPVSVYSCCTWTAQCKLDALRERTAIFFHNGGFIKFVMGKKPASRPRTMRKDVLSMELH